MTYIYAYSNHKTGLSRLRRMAVRYRELQAEGVEVELLTNDFRAAAAIREYGVSACTTIETILDIDYVAQRGDSLIIDSPEEDHGKLRQYVEMFARVEKVATHCEEVSRFGEKTVSVDPLVDRYYVMKREEPKIARTLFFYGDSDPKKWIESAAKQWSGLGMELLLGSYFYPNYEEALAGLFGRLYEAESYRECIAYSSRIVTADTQCAYEAQAAGAEVIYLYEEMEACQREQMETLGIHLLETTDIGALKLLLGA